MEPRTKPDDKLGVLPEGYFGETVAAAGCLFLASMATLLGSVVSLMFYSGASRLGLLEAADKTEV